MKNPKAILQPHAKSSKQSEWQENMEANLTTPAETSSDVQLTPRAPSYEERPKQKAKIRSTRETNQVALPPNPDCIGLSYKLKQRTFF